MYLLYLRVSELLHERSVESFQMGQKPPKTYIFTSIIVHNESFILRHGKLIIFVVLQVMLPHALWSFSSITIILKRKISVPLPFDFLCLLYIWYCTRKLQLLYYTISHNASTTAYTAQNHSSL